MIISQLEEGIRLATMSEAEFKVRRLCGYMLEYQRRHQYGPTIREMGRALGWSSSSTTYRWIETGEAMGLIGTHPAAPGCQTSTRRYYAL
jgi:hypothetical protein